MKEEYSRNCCRHYRNSTSIIFCFFYYFVNRYSEKRWYINAEFGHIGGLKVGDDVVIAGIKGWGSIIQ